MKALIICSLLLSCLFIQSTQRTSCMSKKGQVVVKESKKYLSCLRKSWIEDDLKSRRKCATEYMKFFTSDRNFSIGNQSSSEEAEQLEVLNAMEVYSPKKCSYKNKKCLIPKINAALINLDRICS